MSAVVDPTSPQAWAEQLLSDLGAPARSASDQRVAFLEGWEREEGNWPGTATYAAEHNPLSTSMPEPGSRAVNSDGVQGYPTASAGLEATIATLRQGYDSPIYDQLRQPGSSVAALEDALAGSNWTGSGGGSAPEQRYAQTVASLAPLTAAERKTFASAQGGSNAESDFLPGNRNAENLGQLFSGPSWLKDVYKVVLMAVAGMAGLGLVVMGIHSAGRGEKPKIVPVPL